MTDERPTLRARKKERTRLALEKHAWALFMRDGFSETTVDAIVAAADSSSRTFFRYFGSKEGVLFADLPTEIEQIRTAFDARPVDEPLLDSSKEAVVSVADGWEARRERHLLRARLGNEAPSVALYDRTTVRHAIEDAIATAVSARLDVDPKLDLRPILVASLTSGALGAAHTRWLHGKGDERLPDLVRAAFDLVTDPSSQLVA